MYLTAVCRTRAHCCTLQCDRYNVRSVREAEALAGAGEGGVGLAEEGGVAGVGPAHAVQRRPAPRSYISPSREPYISPSRECTDPSLRLRGKDSMVFRKARVRNLFSESTRLRDG